MLYFNLFLFLLLTFSCQMFVFCGPMAAGICYSGCAALVVVCFSGAGFSFGTVPGSQIAAVPALTACNTAFAVCESACVSALLVPTP